MASTLRKPIASSRNVDPRNELEALSQIHSLGLDPALSTAPHPTCQETGTPRLLVREPIISQIGNAVDVAYASHRKTGGSTVSLFDGNLAGRRLFALSVFPDRTVELYDPPAWRQLFTFVLENLDLALRKGCAIGTWHNRRRNLHVLDIVVCVSNLQAAQELGKCYDQQSIYSLEQHLEIAIPYQQIVSVDRSLGGRND